jgi:hypothetical protein
MRRALEGWGTVRLRIKIFAAIGVAAVIAAAVAGVLAWRSAAAGHQAASPAAARASAGQPVPPAALSTARLLVSAAGRRALTPELSSATAPGLLFPAGTSFTAQPDSWHQAGAYANLSGTLRVPGQAPARVEVGLVRRGARWLVTFEGAAP